MAVLLRLRCPGPRAGPASVTRAVDGWAVSGLAARGLGVSNVHKSTRALRRGGVYGVLRHVMYIAVLASLARAAYFLGVK